MPSACGYQGTKLVAFRVERKNFSLGSWDTGPRKTLQDQFFIKIRDSLSVFAPSKVQKASWLSLNEAKHGFQPG